MITRTVRFDEVALAHLDVSTAGLVLYIEPQAEAQRLLDVIPARALPTTYFFVPHVAQMREFLARLAPKGLGGHVLPYWRVDADADEVLYPKGRELADQVVAGLAEASHRRLGDRRRWVNQLTELPMTISLADAIVSVLRPFSVFHQLEDTWRDKELIVVTRNGYGLGGTLDTLEAIAGYRPRVSLDLVSEAWRTRLRRGMGPPSAGLRPTISVHPTYRPPATSPHAGVLLLTNLKSDQYRHAAMPIARRAADRWNVTIFSAAVATEEMREEVAAGGIPPGSEIIVRDPGGRGYHTFSDRELAALRDTVDGAPAAVREMDGWLAATGSVLAAYLVGRLGRLVVLVDELVEYFTPLVARSRCVVLLPARPMDGQILLRLAHSLGVPSIEVQSGTISPSARFIPPTADWVLAIDDYSKSVLVDRGRHPGSIEIVGSPKLDVDVGPYRAMPQEQARRALPVAGEKLAGRRIVMVASQPIGAERAGTLMRLVVEAVEEHDDTYLVIKPHPGEGAEYAEQYDRIAARLHDRFSIVADLPTNQIVVAADIVITHYSTVGLQAFVLGRPVIAINPFPGRPPFDLPRLGVAWEAADAETLRRLLAPGAGLERLAQEWSLALLQDGQAVQRIVDFIEWAS